MIAINKRLLISESCGALNRCTPYRGKPDQHDMYASHTSPRTPGVRFLLVVHSILLRKPFMRCRQIWTDPTAPEKKGSRHNPQHAG
jgi:hypothetical protein